MNHAVVYDSYVAAQITTDAQRALRELLASLGTTVTEFESAETDSIKSLTKPCGSVYVEPPAISKIRRAYDDVRRARHLQKTAHEKLPANTQGQESQQGILREGQAPSGNVAPRQDV